MISPRQMAFKRIPTLKMRKFIDSINDEALKASLKTVYDAEIILIKSPEYSGLFKDFNANRYVYVAIYCIPYSHIKESSVTVTSLGFQNPSSCYAF